MTIMPPVGDLNLDFLVRAYRAGYFPMAESGDGPISWYSPDPRAIIPLDGVVVSRSLRRTIRSSRFEIRVDTAFDDIIRKCAEREETWISRQIIEAYTGLHRAGFAHSVESWQANVLVGGLYGVALGGAFFGESMFSRVTDASKVAFVHLIQQLNASGYLLLDTQFINDHVRSLGAVEIPRSEYLHRLSLALEQPVRQLW